MFATEDQVQTVAERFCELMQKYNPKRGRLDRYAFVCLTNALHSLRRCAAGEERRNARTESLDALIGKWEGRDDG